MAFDRRRMDALGGARLPSRDPPTARAGGQDGQHKTCIRAPRQKGRVPTTRKGRSTWDCANLKSTPAAAAISCGCHLGYGVWNCRVMNLGGGARATQTSCGQRGHCPGVALASQAALLAWPRGGSPRQHGGARRQRRPRRKRGFGEEKADAEATQGADDAEGDAAPQTARLRLPCVRVAIGSWSPNECDFRWRTACARLRCLKSPRTGASWARGCAGNPRGRRTDPVGSRLAGRTGSGRHPGRRLCLRASAGVCAWSTRGS